jgi:glycosyltransferase involved in cell wall biosynthesis
MKSSGMVSVIMTCHNEEGYIAQAVGSVLGQTAFDRVCEVLIVNDGSMDRSGDILEKLAAGNGKLRILTASGIGPSAARNLALAEAKGEFIAILDGDDVWTPGKLAAQLPVIESDPRIGLVYGDFYEFSRDDMSDASLFQVRRYSARDLDLLQRFFVRGGPIIPSSTIYRKEVFNRAGTFNIELWLSEDSEMALRIAQDWLFQYSDGGRVFKRQHGRNASRNLEQWEAASERVSELMIARVPGLARLRCKRASYRRSKIASAYFSEGKNAAGWKYLLMALQDNPLNRRAYAVILLALIPAGARRPFSRWVKRVRSLILERFASLSIDETKA